MPILYVVRCQLGQRPLGRIMSSNERKNKRWGTPPWAIDFHPAPRAVPDAVEFAIGGGGFNGLATAAWLRHLAPEKSVAVLKRNP